MQVSESDKQQTSTQKLASQIEKNVSTSMLSRTGGTAIGDDEGPTEYLERRVFPILLPAIEKVLKLHSSDDAGKDVLARLAHYLLQENTSGNGTKNTVSQENLNK
ncbi:hypothetical protein SmJEL517_g00701 [Synchytrium microbalum]|uniref:Uncharacterized protein n=1 Tax=Synchytrium microbalum TaxID=1806994 RepID=A0A507C7C8_9FUNG|nr:uncharacterized protein SmJEL517_g00701 [Synchytrium microbalum]TPX37480.1 hypothetical protein SmJEL517_g00701 [Synchytrium microbalum]